jgi:hypothetical protein
MYTHTTLRGFCFLLVTPAAQDSRVWLPRMRESEARDLYDSADIVNRTFETDWVRVTWVNDCYGR